MKTYCHLLAAIAAAFVGSVSTTPCTVDQTRSAYLNMISLLTGSTVSDCATNSGYNMLYYSAAPTNSQMISLCGVQVCHDLVVRVLATSPPDCDLVIPTSQAVMNVSNTVARFGANDGLVIVPSLRAWRGGLTAARKFANEQDWSLLASESLPV
ncbi:hypothetical protein PHYSODRAFT_515189 [Phytophthora sojae]|uniref:Elicitin n=2 Tax=Phytophthora sojae TaxID=67593 RepID=G4ZXI9_PHYSP|nr:hypothetical protein PHYSODRAFT_515189 [Phytophthora sojae]ABB56001.1 putative elicitin protein SOJ6B [Phytophthora sojae]EGZ11852.1 hypothetical protein PHYSODRAFT_515189 [Phytophthora sojae]|eukprot:XP_009532185.1 hypothetical protein PHYSODRAFT_515189 [Phytophthora sojae]